MELKTRSAALFGELVQALVDEGIESGRLKSIPRGLRKGNSWGMG